MNNQIENKDWHCKSIEEIWADCESNKDGLEQQQVEERRIIFGENKLLEAKSKTILAILLDQFKDFMIWVLIIAALISWWTGEHIDAAIILFVVILNGILGTIQEAKAESALEALKNMAAPFARVIRAGTMQRIPAAEIVPGDIIALEAGDSVPADLRLIECASLKIEESALTGESVPVEKNLAVKLERSAVLGDRLNMAFTGSNVTYGRGMGIAVDTGMNTQMGKIAQQLTQTPQETTPLQKKLNQISNVLSVGVLIIAALIFAVGILGGREAYDMFFIAVSLSVAAIPEGMVAVVTIVLAMGMSRMADRGAIIRRLPAVETLGSTQIICSDKTGTLTQNKMTVTSIHSENTELLYQAMGFCNDAQLGAESQLIGDPTETALIDYLLKEKLWDEGSIKSRQRDGEIPFDSERKRSTVAIKQADGMFRVFVKGAPDQMLSLCELQDNALTEILQQNDKMTEQALRVLAFAYKDSLDFNAASVTETESGLNFLGLVGMIDPPRDEAKAAMETCQIAGLTAIMITGDHKGTALAIAKDLGMLRDDRIAVSGAELEEMKEEEFEQKLTQIGVYARVAPEHKSRIVRAWQKRGKIVAMTGDGVNDAPALKAADIGVGMGITGTDVSKGASDMVLTDDNFATIVAAVEEGRRIFDNIHKTVRFLLSSNAGEVIAILVATIAGWNLLAPIHILWINLVTDTFPALALGVEPAEADVMRRPPRDSKIPFFTKKEWGRILVVGLVEAILTLAAFVIGNFYYESASLGTTMAFVTLAMTQLFAAIGFQSERSSVFTIKFKEHNKLWLAFLLSTALQLSVVLVPTLRDIFKLSPLNIAHFGIIALLAVLMLIFIETQKFVARRTAD